MKNFIGGVLFGMLVYPAITYCASILETGANLIITKLSVVMAQDAAKLEQDEPTVTHAIGFVAPDDDYEED